MYVCMTLLPSTIGRLKDDKGERKYAELKKPRLPNHKLLNPQKENQRCNQLLQESESRLVLNTLMLP